jgi:hypothetical protein
MSVARSSNGGTRNNCCDPCNKCVQSRAGKNRGERRSLASKVTKGGCNGTQTATLKWNCGDSPVNSAELFGTKCSKVQAEWNCVPIISLGSPSKTGTGCNCPSCGKAQVAAIAAANKTKPDPKREKTDVTWTNAPTSDCPKLGPNPCPNGPCYKAQKPYTKPNLPDTPLPNITWSC